MKSPHYRTPQQQSRLRQEKTRAIQAIQSRQLAMTMQVLPPSIPAWQRYSNIGKDTPRSAWEARGVALAKVGAI